MSTEAQVSPGEETQNNAPETETPEIVTPEVDAEAEQEAAPEGDDAEKALKRMQRRIDKRTADVYRTRGENEALKARLAELEAKSTGSTETTRQEQADPEVIAEEISSIRAFTAKANSLVAEGTKKHSDYMDAIGDLQAEIGPLVVPAKRGGDKQGLPSPFMAVVLEVAEKPTELLYHLGKNPDIAADLADLSPIQLAKRLDRIERELTDQAKPKTSNAPKPLEPIKGKAADSDLGSGLSDAEWMRRREAQIRERRGG
jgi:hypothetical protein